MIQTVYRWKNARLKHKKRYKTVVKKKKKKTGQSLDRLSTEGIEKKQGTEKKKKSSQEKTKHQVKIVEHKKPATIRKRMGNWKPRLQGVNGAKAANGGSAKRLVSLVILWDPREWGGNRGDRLGQEE